MPCEKTRDGHLQYGVAARGLKESSLSRPDFEVRKRNIRAQAVEALCEVS